MRASVLAAAITCVGVIVAAIITGVFTQLGHSTTTVTVTTPVTLAATSNTTTEFGTVPNVIGENIRTAQSEVSNSGFRPNPLASPSSQTYEQVYDQRPKGGTRYPNGGIVDLYFSAGNRSYATISSLSWGQKVELGISVGPKFAVRGQLINSEYLGKNTLYVILNGTANRYWVQDKPIILANGTWIGTLSYGVEDLSNGFVFEIHAIITNQSLIPGENLTKIPQGQTIFSIKLVQFSPFS